MPTGSTTAPDLDRDTQLLGDVVTEAMDRLHVPGVAVGILHEGREIVAGYGVTSVDYPLSVDPDTLFQIGSTSKTFTATAVMRLVEQGTIDLDSPILTYLPSFRMADESATSHATTRHLFTHTAGWAGDYFYDTGRGDDTLALIVERMADLPQITPLGENMSYNNAGFYLAGRVIEVVTGKPYEAAVKELVLDPLGLSRSFFFPEDVMTYSFAVGHRVHEGKPEVLRPWGLARSANAAGGVVSTVRDQLRYARFHLGDGTAFDGTRILKRETLEEMQSPHAPASSFADAMGISWRLMWLDGIKIAAHGGGTLGQASSFDMVPERGFAITVLSNTKDRLILDEIVLWAFDHFLGIPKPSRVPLAVPADRLERYAGTYTARGSDAEIYVRGGELYLQLRPKGGFPTPDVPPPATPPATRLAFYREDFVYQPDSPLSRFWGEFVRDKDGSILGFHSGARLLMRHNQSDTLTTPA